MTTPTIGRIVHVPADPAKNNGADVAPAIITRVWNDTGINVRVLTDSPEAPEWRTSVARVDELPTTARGEVPARVWAWPARS